MMFSIVGRCGTWKISGHLSWERGSLMGGDEGKNFGIFLLGEFPMREYGPSKNFESLS
jgi:hypothetical protein